MGIRGEGCRVVGNVPNATLKGREGGGGGVYIFLLSEWGKPGKGGGGGTAIESAGW